MTNNKQSMKLYTEEHLKLFYQLGKFDGIAGRQTDVEEEIKNHLPIEMPTDEEIDKEAFQVPYDNTRGFYDLQFIKGAKWMRNKIQGGNK
jgi:hypothetical protein